MPIRGQQGLAPHHLGLAVDGLRRVGAKGLAPSSVARGQESSQATVAPGTVQTGFSHHPGEGSWRKP